MSRSVLFAVAVAIMLSTNMPTSAHHAFASEYDENKHVAISGTVTQFKWTNPHVLMDVEGRDESGKVTRWSFEMGSPNRLLTRGWKKTDLKVGDHIIAEGFGAKDGSKVANATWIILPGGRKLYGGFQETPGAPPKPSYPPSSQT
jgi:hypothetical protein